MRILSGTTDQYIYFVAVDSTDLSSRETGLSSFIVYRSRDGGTATAMTTPTINETDSTNMPGVYELLLDEDTTIAAGNDTEEIVFHITHTGMAPVTRVIELYRPKITAGYTLGIGSDGDLLEVNSLTGHTAQTGDSYAIVNNGTYGNAAIRTQIGTSGAGLTSIPWNASWDAEVQSECTDALTAFGTATTSSVSGLLPINISSLVISTSGVANSNVKLISDDETAADNLEAVYDGTGYSDPYAPAQQQQLDNLAIGSAGLSVVADSVTVTTGTPTGTYTNTHQADSVYHEYADDTGVIDTYYEFNIGGNGVPSTVTILGKATGLNDLIGVYGYNWGTTSWQQVGTVPGGNADVERTFSLYTSHVGTGTDIGKVRVRFYNTGLTTAIFYIDQLYVTYANNFQSVGYSNGSIWIDTNNGTAGTTPYVNGTADNPVNTLADGLTISASLGLTRFHVASQSNITLSSDSSGLVGIGENWNLDLNGQVISNGTAIGATITGAANASSTSALIIDCHFGTCSITPLQASNCAIESTITLLATGTYIFHDCYSAVAGTSTPVLDLNSGVGATYINFRNYSGGIEIQNMTSLDVMSLEGRGQLVINANCTGGSISIRGLFKVTDNSGGSVTLIEEANYNATNINAQVDAALNTAIPASPTAKSINDYILRTKYTICNKMEIDESTGESTIYDDAGSSFSNIAAAFTTLTGVTTRKKII